MIQLEKCSEYSKGGELTGDDKEHQEVSMLTLHLLQSALVYVNTILLQRVLADPACQRRITDADRRALTPLFWSNANLYGRIDIDMDRHLDLAPDLEMVETRGEHGRWNHNIHYHPVVLAAVPDRAQRALDVGCGEGTLARTLRSLVAEVVGIDRDPRSIERAWAQDDPGHPVDYVRGDFLDHRFAPGSFDLVASVAALHHMDAAGALARMRELLRPGGVLVVIGLARADLPADLPIEIAAATLNLLYRLTRRRSYWQAPSPTVRPPAQTYTEMRRLASEVLPGARFRRHVLFRYSLIWTKSSNREPEHSWSAWPWRG